MRRLWPAFLLLLVLPAMATVFRSGNTVNIPAGQTIDDDLVVSGSNITIAGKVTGDVVAAGSNVRVTGPVGGDLIVAGSNVTVDGPVSGTLYGASSNLVLNAPVARNLVAAGSAVHLNKGANVTRDATLNGTDVTVGSRIGRNLRANATNLTLAAGAVVGGDLTGQVQNRHIAPGATIAGTQQLTQPARRGSAAWLFIWPLLTGAALLAAGWIFVALAPRLTHETETTLRENPGASLGIGALILLVGVPLFGLLLATVIGIPLAFIWLSVYLTAVYLSPIFLAILVGHLVWRRPGGSLFTALAIGIGLMVVIRFIPILGSIVTLGMVLLGLGALAIALYRRSVRRRTEKEIQPEAPPQAPPQAA